MRKSKNGKAFKEKTDNSRKILFEIIMKCIKLLKLKFILKIWKERGENKRKLRGSQVSPVISFLIQKELIS